MDAIMVEALVPNGVKNADVPDVNRLLKEFSPDSTPLEFEKLRQICRDDFMFVARNAKNEIVGMTTLIIYRKPTGLVGLVEDVIVTEKCRGMGAGRKLMKLLIEVATHRQVESLELTSNPRRIAARALYKSLGFEARDTTCFELDL